MNSILRGWIDPPPDIVLPLSPAGDKEFLRPLCIIFARAVRTTICIGARVGLMESPGSRERTDTWMGSDIDAALYVRRTFVTFERKLAARSPKRLLRVLKFNRSGTIIEPRFDFALGKLEFRNVSLGMPVERCRMGTRGYRLAGFCKNFDNRVWKFI